MVQYILGTMNIAYPYSSSPNATIESYAEIIQTYFDSTKTPFLDTAYYYGNTKTEAILGEIFDRYSDLSNCKIATKVNPWFQNDFLSGRYGQLSSGGIHHQLNTSLKNLRRSSVDILYLHCPDPETELQETIHTMDELFRQEKCTEWGISNYSLESLVQIYDICERQYFQPPKYYQGMYNALSRKIEVIFPFLADHSMHFWAYNPLAGGLLSGKYCSSEVGGPSRLDEKNIIYQNLFGSPLLKTFLKDTKISPTEMKTLAFQFLQRKLKKEEDGIIIGVSTADQYRDNWSCLSHENKITDVLLNRWMSSTFCSPIEHVTPNYYY